MARSIDLNVWTVNEIEYMGLLYNYKNNGMIADYRDIARKVVDEYDRKL